jgi:DMSO/TMAO reductase YedYZ molybdopterin-dependent catalytic subunit
VTRSQGVTTGGSSRVLRAGRRTNVALLALVLGAFASGVLAYGTGTAAPAELVTVAHGAFGLGLLLLVPWKSVIVRRSIRRGTRRFGNGAGVALGVLLVVAVAAGVVHAVGGYHSVFGVTALTVHVGAAVLALPFLAAHAWGRRQRPRRGDLSRRTVLRAGALGLGSVATYGSIEAVSSLLGLPGGHRRQTGSYELGSGMPDRMPVTQWFTDTVPTVDRESWRITVGSRTVPYTELSAGRDSVRAVLDCTGGWYAEQEWRGVRMDRLIGPIPDGTRSIDVVSVTGYRRRFPLSDVGSLLLATRAAGEPLSDGHGGPVRLVAPGRRGFWWVKWVERIETTSEPWWLQAPFPLQ